jgi:anti-sigma-K factor RskA
MSPHERQPDVGAYLLGELDAEQRALFERALAGDAALRAEVERLRPIVARLDALPAEAWADGEPPPLRLTAAVLAEAAVAVDATTPVAAESVAREPSFSRRAAGRRLRSPLAVRPALAALAAAALLAGGIAIGVLLDDDGTPARPAVQAQRELPLQPIGSLPAARGRVLVAERGARNVTLRVRGLAPSRAGELYELWLLNADGRLIALGSFRVGADGRASVRMPLPVPVTTYQYFDVSVEPEDGDPGHSGASILRGATRA